MEVEVEVMRPIAAATGAAEFNFESACTTPYISAPSSPQRFGSFFYSAPTSPTRVSTFYTSSHRWEETSGIPKPNNNNASIVDDDDDDFAFDFSGQLEVTTADELFDGGKIKPLKPPPPPPPNPNPNPNPNQERGRERTCRNKKSSGGGGRSLSPFRVSDLLLDSEDIKNAKLDSDHPSSSSSSSSSSAARRLSSSFVSFWYTRKWKLKDLLLFRSASDGHSMTKEQLNKYAVLQKHQANEDVKNSSFRSTDSCGSSSTTSRPPPPPRTRGGGGGAAAAVLSAHELHYRAKRAMAQDLKRKTSLPYKPAGFFGCLGFNPAADISRNFGASSTSVSPS